MAVASLRFPPPLHISSSSLNPRPRSFLPNHALLPFYVRSLDSPMRHCRFIAASSGPVETPVPEPESKESDSGDGIEIEVTKVGRNRRKVKATVDVGAGLEIVWGLLTDYEGLADFIPSLSVCQLLEKGDKFAKLYQVGQQDLALGLKFNAKGILDCYEKDLQLLPSGRRRNIEFRMVEGDFQTFEGVWSILENCSEKCKDECFGGQEFPTILSYVVELEPKLWLPVRLLEGRVCQEIRNNLLCIREEAQRVVQGTHPSCTTLRVYTHLGEALYGYTLLTSWVKGVPGHWQGILQSMPREMSFPYTVRNLPNGPQRLP